MLKRLSIYFAGIPAVFLDGTLYCVIAFFGFATAQLGTEEAVKFISPHTLFWLKTLCGAISATALSLKMFRSTAFAEHKQEKKLETAFFEKSKMQP